MNRKNLSHEQECWLTERGFQFGQLAAWNAGTEGLAIEARKLGLIADHLAPIDFVIVIYPEEKIPDYLPSRHPKRDVR